MSAFRCVGCKRVVEAAVEPMRCADCGCRTFAQCAELPAACVTFDDVATWIERADLAALQRVAELVRDRVAGVADEIEGAGAPN